ncbi:MAG: response regulator [Syntrophales bacterium]|jgi:putative nucleotidyltransferase with HDIG domain|nr:response regulator [Syntrophales bacterium]
MLQPAVPDLDSLKKRILVVDDDAALRQLITETLAGRDYLLAEAENGAQAMQMFLAGHFDLVITDMMMPGMSGMELLGRIREARPETPVLVITAHPATNLAVTAMKKGAVDFLPKPFDIDNLVFKVGISLEESEITGEGGREARREPIEVINKKEELSLRSYIYESIENTSGGNDQIFQKIVDMAIQVVDGESSALLLYDDNAKAFHPQVIKSDDVRDYLDRYIPRLTPLFLSVVEKRQAAVAKSGEDGEFLPTIICSPLMIRSQVFGVLTVKKDGRGPGVTQNDLQHIQSLTNRAALNLENKVLYDSLYGNLIETFKSLVASIQVRDHYTEEHSRRVMNLALEVAQAMGCDEAQQESLRIAAMLHDIGKIAIPDTVLLKPGRLTDDEYAIIKKHPVIGESILQSIVIFEEERDIILHHHERWDGRGYPEGLAGENIPLLARILCVADSYDAMTNTRPYRQAMRMEDAVVELLKNRGTQFDEQVVDCLVRLLIRQTPSP